MADDGLNGAHVKFRKLVYRKTAAGAEAGGDVGKGCVNKIE